MKQWVAGSGVNTSVVSSSTAPLLACPSPQHLFCRVLCFRRVYWPFLSTWGDVTQSATMQKVNLTGPTGDNTKTCLLLCSRTPALYYHTEISMVPQGLPVHLVLWCSAVAVRSAWRTPLTCTHSQGTLLEAIMDLSACPLRSLKCQRFLLCMTGSHQSDCCWCCWCCWGKKFLVCMCVWSRKRGK